MVPLVAEYEGPVYMRISRAAVPDVFEKDYVPQIGKGVVVRVGQAATVISTGSMLGRCLLAADLLAQQGVDVRVINMATIKPVDRELLVQAAVETGAIVTAEEHSILGGLGGAVAEILAILHPAPIEMVGLADTFAETGPDPETLMDAWGLSVNDILQAVNRVILRKK
jgi:transketolase